MDVRRTDTPKLAKTNKQTNKITKKTGKSPSNM